MTILANKTDLVRAGSGTWQDQMKWAIRDLRGLRDALGLAAEGGLQLAAEAEFPVFAPLPYLARINSGDLGDPLLRQVWPSGNEMESPGHFSTDPLGESDATTSSGMLQKYQGRVLLVTTGACAVHCRYCFRRHFPYEQSPKSVVQWEPTLAKIAADESVEEVILSGGDPLTIVDHSLDSLVSRIDEIAHVKRIRFHTRLPIMIPQRVTDAFLGILANARSQMIVVIHANHANELDLSVEQALSKIANSGAMLLNQAVLLRGVNDSLGSLKDLSERLLSCRVLPYYLHQLDPVNGAAHFEVDVKQGLQLITELRSCLPGYAVPRYVQELRGEPNKTVLA
ncbi:EF-P beta-lysylation protein EpmB [Mariniblastus sp.]|jgi:L-lysine 2,3-aminomutase|nr:EF-P beta-lysylation protein EpmB [Mariniblastus sp.]MDA7924704.1 EF-P beta-lysylation protein EpmB [Mariniblastus sp.]MDB4544978.1 EF-P beta-lysylation protein EpmB [bacterium]MDC0294278.1 EF-P beta-lysylation protein EpmB [Mariniblastus sp.]